jgi:HlyD family secretion protein
MDKKIEKKRWTLKKIGIPLTIFIVISFFLIKIFFFSGSHSKIYIKKDMLNISKVEYGDFQEYIPTIGTIMPQKAVFIDAIQSGTTKSIFKESGAIVKKGDELLEMSNSNLELNVLTQESALYERISILKTQRLGLNQNNLSQLAQLAEIDFQLKTLRPQYERYKKLIAKKLIAQRDFEQLKEQYDYNMERKKLFIETYRMDSLARKIQLEQINRMEISMQESLEKVRRILKDLIIVAPIDGQLSTPEWEIGQSINIGQRIGQIDELDKYKVRVPVEENYKGRIREGLKGSVDLLEDTFKLVISKIYPTVTNGTFDVDMSFIGKIPSNLTRGQTVRINLALSDPHKSKLIPIGGYYNYTGGNWVYSLDKSRGKAYKKNIKTGRQNPDYIELVEGLEVDDEIITSSYENFGNKDVLIIQ